jgi:hypothetical protein
MAETGLNVLVCHTRLNQGGGAGAAQVVYLEENR